MSKETKLAKKEKKAAKKAAKAEKAQAAAYAKLVKNIEKKNAKAEKKAAKKNKPFVPIAIPTMEEALAATPVNKKKQIVKMIILLLLIAYIIYFLVMWFTYVAPIKNADTEPTVTEYDRYVNQHEITTTPDYTVAEAKEMLKQVLHDNYKDLGYSSDPSSGSINHTGNILTVNNADCYEFTASGKKYAVSIKLQSVYLYDNGEFVPLTFHGTSLLGFDE